MIVSLFRKIELQSICSTSVADSDGEVISNRVSHDGVSVSNGVTETGHLKILVSFISLFSECCDGVL
jgi:hypothetical protein